MDDDMPNDSESDYHEKKKIVRQIQSNRQDKKYPKKRDKDS